MRLIIVAIAHWKTGREYKYVLISRILSRDLTEIKDIFPPFSTVFFFVCYTQARALCKIISPSHAKT